MSPEGSDEPGDDREMQTLTSMESPVFQESRFEPALAAEDEEEWRDRALRLQAERENYRKRQQRLAEERITEEREWLLRRILKVADDLERALNTQHIDVDNLLHGMELSHQNLMQILEQENVRPIDAQDQPFDPQLHEAVGTVPLSETGSQPQMVVVVLRPGYRLGRTSLATCSCDCFWLNTCPTKRISG
jgi:molecular chaperone GrpE